ncbi:hypothetical protein MKX01_014097 [Papaver californicum]|nr:hypothetical protein MKX01_014097 [Papaver californicum]
MYCTKIWKIARNIVSLGYDDRRKVPWELKEEIWRSLKNAYKVPENVKDKAIKKANLAWKKSKIPLRQICDKCSSNAEMRNKKPGNVKKEDWDAFVVMMSKDEDYLVRARGKLARIQLKALHRMDRAGIATRRHEMEKESPTGSVTRAQVYVDTHVYQEIPEESLDPESYEAKSRQLVVISLGLVIYLVGFPSSVFCYPPMCHFCILCRER